MIFKILKKTVVVLMLLLSIGVVLLGTLYGYFSFRNSQSTGTMATPFQPAGLCKYVNPFIGTAGYPWVCANNFPGASLPFGVVRLSPDTQSSVFRKKALSTSGYYFPDNQIMGFSHTRLSGTGATDGGHFRVIPSTEEKYFRKYLSGSYSSYSHKEEAAFPGYYAVKLKNPDVLVELTTTQRTGIHRYTFYGGQPHLLIDICSMLGEKRVEEAKVSVNSATREVQGEVRTFGTFAGRYGGIKVYFFARFDQPFAKAFLCQGDRQLEGKTSGEGEQLGVDLLFERKSENQVVGLKLGISHVSCENAKLNLETETSGKSFDDLVAAAQQVWNEKLALVKLDSIPEKEGTIFYTALYRSFQMPTLFQDVNGEYFGFDKKVHQAEGYNYYTDLSLWDTFRTLHPLYILIAPKEQRDMLVSLVKMKEQGGWLPRWPSGNGYTGSMLGSPADMVISESFQKGIHDFDVKSAFKGMKEVALMPTPEGARFSGRKGIKDYIDYKYGPSDRMEQSVSRTLEYAWADYAIAKLADTLGYKGDAALFYEHSSYYKNTWNPDTKYFQPRNSEGTFDAFKPLLLSYFDSHGKYTNDYVEGSALQWRFAVPFDSDGLIGLFGGKEKFVKELNDFFAKSDPEMSSWNPGSYYWHGNEPDIHSAYLFNDAGRPDLTQKWAGWILANKYAVNASGLDGNDDGATLSSWYIFASLGLYPIAGTTIYEIGAPLFRHALVKMGDKTLEIVADNFSPENRYVSKVWLNGRLLSGWKLRHAEIQNGGQLKFEMSKWPVKFVN